MKKILYLIVTCLLVCISCQNPGTEEQKQQSADSKTDNKTESQTAGNSSNNEAFNEYVSIIEQCNAKIKVCTTCEEFKQCIQEKNVQAIEFLQKYGKDAIQTLTDEEKEKVKELDKENQQLQYMKYDKLCQ